MAYCVSYTSSYYYRISVVLNWNGLHEKYHFRISDELDRLSVLDEG